MRPLRLVAFLALVLIALGALAPPAAAGGPVVVADRAGDGKGPGDIRGLRLLQGAGERVVVQVRTARPLNILTSPAWSADGSVTVLRFNFDTGGTNAADHFIEVRPAPGEPDVQVFSVASGSPRAACAEVRQPQLTVIRVVVAVTCLSEPSEVRTFARYRLDRGGNGTIDSDDRAPNRIWSPRISIML